MRRITLWLFSTAAALVLLFSYRTSTSTGGAEATAARTVIAAPPATGGPADPAGTKTKAKTYTGTAAATRWGDVQVAITVANGKITDVRAPVYPNDNHRDQEINAYALPILRQAVLDAQSADIDTVSGATVTSEGYLKSLQSALDAAHLS